MPGLTFGQLSDEEPAFVAYLQTTGDIWARSVRDDAVNPQFAPLPVAEFLEKHAGAVRQYDVVDIYLGERKDVLTPQLGIIEVVEGGTPVPFVQFGQVVPGAHSIVGGTKVQKQVLKYNANRYVRYTRGEYRAADVLASSNLGYPSSWFNGQVSIKHPPAFLKWGANILNWMRRRTPDWVPVYRCNYETRATIKLAQACRDGLKLGV